MKATPIPPTVPPLVKGDRVRWSPLAFSLNVPTSIERDRMGVIQRDTDPDCVEVKGITWRGRACDINRKYLERVT